MTETLCDSGAVKNKAGVNATTTVTNNPTIMTQFINQAEGHIAAETRVDWVDSYSGLSANFKKALEGACAAKAAISVLNYNLAEVGINESVTRINILRDEYKEAIKVLSDEKVVSAFGGTKLT